MNMGEKRNAGDLPVRIRLKQGCAGVINAELDDKATRYQMRGAHAICFSTQNSKFEKRRRLWTATPLP